MISKFVSAVIEGGEFQVDIANSHFDYIADRKHFLVYPWAGTAEQA